MTNKKILDSRGSSTLELTIIFPFILFLLVAVIFFALFIYHKITFMDAAIYSAKQSAATWSNSEKDLETGSMNRKSGDGLYWRVFDDYAGSTLVQKKTGKTDRFAHNLLLVSLLGEKETGSIVTSYNRGLVKRSVSVKIEKAMLRAAATAEISEPAEFIRDYLMGKEYMQELRQYLKTFGQGSVPSDKGPVIASRKSNVYGQKLYHFPGCKHLSKIKQENIIEFGSEDKAAKGGFNLCIDCAKSLLGGKGK